MTEPSEGTTALGRRTSAGLEVSRGSRGSPSAAVRENCRTLSLSLNPLSNTTFIFRCNYGALLTGSVVLVISLVSFVTMF